MIWRGRAEIDSASKRAGVSRRRQSHPGRPRFHRDAERTLSPWFGAFPNRKSDLIPENWIVLSWSFPF
jgi:hypothetical protein